MRKTFVAMVLAMAVAAVAQAGSIALVPAAMTVSTGVTFTVDVVVTDVSGDVLNVEVAFNPSLVNAKGASEGSWFSAQQPTDLPLSFGYLMDNVNGVMSYTITRLGPTISTGNGTAATLTFECMADGLTTLDYYVAVSDAYGAIVADATDSVSVQQGEGGAVPEPMTLALVGAALTALGMVARKRS